MIGPPEPPSPFPARHCLASSPGPVLLKLRGGGGGGGGETGPGRHCQGPSAHALFCPRIPGVTVISFWKPFRILV